MKQYTSCFIGVPLPEKYQEEFEKLLNNIGELYPNWEITYPKTPHVTIYYLDKQSQNVLPSIEGVIRAKINQIKNIDLVVRGFDYFTKSDKRSGIVFLDIVYPTIFVDLNKELASELNQYNSADNNLPFHPHMTVAMVNGLKNDLSLKNIISDLVHRIGKIYWKFSITEIVLYGVESTKHPQYQEKLITIPVK